VDNTIVENIDKDKDLGILVTSIRPTASLGTAVGLVDHLTCTTVWLPILV
jgi:hypothetical protein